MSNLNNKLEDIFNKKKMLDHNYELIKNNIVHKTAFINWDKLLVGTGNIFGPFSVVGSEAQHKYFDTEGKIEIGNNNVFHSFTDVSCSHH